MSCAGIQPPLNFLEHGRLEDGRTTRFSLGIEARRAVRAIAFDRTFDADAGDPEGPYDLRLLRIARDTELGGDHPKGGAVLFLVTEHGQHAVEVGHFPIAFHEGQLRVDLGGTVGEQRQKGLGHREAFREQGSA